MRRWPILLCVVGCVGEQNSTSLSVPSAPMPAVSDASRALAARVDQLGAELLAQNPFLGVSPTFAVVGRPGREIGHPNLQGVLVSEGLAAQLTDDELATVLALELGAMSREAKLARNYANTQSFPKLPSGGGYDPNHEMMQALHAAKPVSPAATVGSAEELAKQILESSGRSTELVARMAGVHAEASHTPAGPGTLGNKVAPPRWTN